VKQVQEVGDEQEVKTELQMQSIADRALCSAF
jgi:hypothetical protein